MAEPTNGNGSRIWDIVKTLLIAGIIGVITMWGSTQRMDERLKNIEFGIAEVRASINTTSAVLTDHLIKSASGDSSRDTQIQTNTQILRDLRADQVRRQKKEWFK